jgi:hypothetical protein
MNRDSILSVYSDARAEYTKQLCVFLVPAYFQFFTDLLEKTKQTSEPKKSLWQFQTNLNDIHDWNMEKVNNEIHTIHTNSGCDYLEDLLTAVFIAHTKVLTAIRLSSNNKKIEINIPKVEHFLFKALCETSKLLWSSTYLFRDGIPGVEKQQNYRNIEQLINDGIVQAVRSLVPVKSILKDFVNNDDDDEDDKKEDTPVTEPVPTVEEPVPTVEEPVPTVPVPTIEEPVPTVIVPVPTVKEPEVEEPEVEEPEVEEPEEPQNHQTIIIKEKPNVQFGKFNAMFDSDNPDESNMVCESNEIPDLQILEGSSEPLSGIDFDNLEESKLENNEYEILI